MRCPKQNSRSWGAKLYGTVQHQLGFEEGWLPSPPYLLSFSSWGGGLHTPLGRKYWGKEEEREAGTSSLPVMPVEIFAVLWPWLLFESTSLGGVVGDLQKHLRVGYFSSVFSYEGAKISSCGWSFAFPSAFWNLYHLQLLSFEFCSICPGDPCLIQAVYSCSFCP